jgi:hypothetical protein
MDNLFDRVMSVLTVYRERFDAPPADLRELCDEVFHHPVRLYVQERVRDIAKSVGVVYR